MELIRLIFLIIVLPAPAPHILNDGFVERSFAVHARDTTAICEYRIGMNNNTMKDLVKKWSAGLLADSQKQETDRIEKTSDSNPTVRDTSSSEDPVNGSSPDSKQPDHNDETTKSSPVNPSASNDQTPGTKKPVSPDDIHWLDPVEFAKFTELSKQTIVKNVEVRCDGRVLELKNASIGPPPRHPFYLVVKFEFELPKSGSFDLSIRDNNFSSHDGAVRYALKTQGKALLLNSNVAPTIIRSKRVELGELSEKETKDQTTISAKIGIQGPPRSEK